MFGLEAKAPALGSQEDNGKEGEKKGRFMAVCVPSQVVGTYWRVRGGGAFVCQNVCVCVCSRGVAESCPPVGKSNAMCAQSMYAQRYMCVSLQMLAPTHVRFSL